MRQKHPLTRSQSLPHLSPFVDSCVSFSVDSRKHSFVPIPILPVYRRYASSTRHIGENRRSAEAQGMRLKIRSSRVFDSVGRSTSCGFTQRHSSWGDKQSEQANLQCWEWTRASILTVLFLNYTSEWTFSLFYFGMSILLTLVTLYQNILKIVYVFRKNIVIVRYCVLINLERNWFFFTKLSWNTDFCITHNAKA